MQNIIPFFKYTGIGNDFVIFNCLEFDDKTIESLENKSFAKRICNRHFGIGSDGILLLRNPTTNSHYRMSVINSDGTHAEMCGNGIRCLAKYIIDYGLCEDNSELVIETSSGLKSISVNPDKQITVDMGKPYLDPVNIPTLFAQINGLPQGELIFNGKSYKAAAVGMGNPHLVIPIPNFESIDLTVLGPLFEVHSAFPSKTNVHFVQITDKNQVKVKVWERGSGPTLACGTGACATLVACYLLGLTENSSNIILPGGKLFVSWPTIDSAVQMTGSAEYLFRGEINL